MWLNMNDWPVHIVVGLQMPVHGCIRMYIYWLVAHTSNFRQPLWIYPSYWVVISVGKKIDPTIKTDRIRSQVTSTHHRLRYRYTSSNGQCRCCGHPNDPEASWQFEKSCVAVTLNKSDRAARPSAIACRAEYCTFFRSGGRVSPFIS